MDMTNTPSNKGVGLDACKCVDAEEDNGNEHEKGENPTGDEHKGEQLVVHDDAPSQWRRQRGKFRSRIVLVL
jgi:hypothetical protein